MKNLFLTKTRWVVTIIAILTFGVSQVWATAGDVINLVDFTRTGNLGKSDYTATWDIAANTNSSGNVACKVYHATSNNVTYVCFGGRNFTNLDAYLGTKSATSVPVASVSVKILKVTNKATPLISINSAKLYVYGSYNSGTNTYSNQIDCVDFTSSYAANTTVTISPTSGLAWASGVYFKLVLNITNTDTSNNDYTSIEYMKATEGSTKTVSSIALKTSATKTAYVAGEDFNPAGMVITATYSDASTEDIAYDSHSGDFSFSPSTNLTAGTTSVTVTYATKTCTQSINVYAVTLQALDENGDAIRAGGPAAPTRTGATVTKAANAGNYTFKEWVVTNATLENGANSNQKIITNPTGAVTVTVKYYLPRVVRWLVDGEAWTPYTTTGSGTDGSAECARGAQWKTLTLPTDPAPLSGEGCGQKFVGWTNSEISGMLDKDDDAAAISTLVSSYLLNSENKSSKTNTINAATYTFYAVFADYVE